MFKRTKVINCIGEIMLSTKWNDHRNIYYLINISKKNKGHIYLISNRHNISKTKELY